MEQEKGKTTAAGQREKVVRDEQTRDVEVRENAKGGQYGYISKTVLDQFVILSRSEEREEEAAWLSEG